MLLRQIFDPKLAQYAYLVGCQATGEALILDPQRDVDRYVEAAEAEGLRLTAAAETHIHADFLSGARELRERYGVRLYLSAEGGEDWQYGWAAGDDGVTLLENGDTFRVGDIELTALHTPGHTPEHLSFSVVDHGSGASEPMGVATGDFVFVGDVGRPDLLEQAAGVEGVHEDAARTLFASLPTFTALPEHLQVWPGHGAGSACGKSLGAVPVTTVGYEKRHNAALDAARLGEDAFVGAILEGQPEPQTYFARMKRQNRDGPAILGPLPRPPRLAAQEVAGVLADDDVIVVDARLDRSSFMARHLPGSLHAPLNRSFNTVVGSLVEDAARPLVLVLDRDDVEEAVRDLVRIGHDRVLGFVEPATLERYLSRDGGGAAIDEIDFDDVAELWKEEGVSVLDVRSASEYAAGHIPGACNAPYTRLPLYGEDRLPPGRTLLVHCGSGARAAAASAFLVAAGHDVKYVNDDWSAWAGGGHPVEKGAADPSPAGGA